MMKTFEKKGLHQTIILMKGEQLWHRTLQKLVLQ